MALIVFKYSPKEIETSSMARLIEGENFLAERSEKIILVKVCFSPGRLQCQFLGGIKKQKVSGVLESVGTSAEKADSTQKQQKAKKYLSTFTLFRAMDQRHSDRDDNR